MAFLFYALSDTLLNRKKLFDDKVPAIKNVEFLRLIFTFGVVVCHFAEKLEITTEGWLSVDFFFILSGFFLAVTFRPDRSTEKFIKSKIIHFTPLLFLFALLSKPKIIPVLSNVFLLQSTGLSDEVVPVQSWYLAILFWGGLFYFYMMKICPEKINKLVFGLLTFFLYCICRSCEWEGVFGRFLSIRLLRGVPGMGLGYFVALIYQRYRDGEQRKSFLFSAIESVLLFYCVGIVFFRPLCPDNRVVAIIAAALLILLFALRRGFVSRFLEKPFFAKISACSFSIYMAHWVFITDVFMHWYKRMSDLQEHKIAAIVVVAVLSYVLGLFVHLYIEKPSSAWLKKKLS